MPHVFARSRHTPGRDAMTRYIAVAPGRVNLIGDHTDYTGGLVFPMAIDRYTTITFETNDHAITLTSSDEHGEVELGTNAGAREDVPSWGRYIRAVRDLVPNPRGIIGDISTTIPVGAGLSSSAALEVATALALGFTGSDSELAHLARAAEHAATGVPCGIMDQLCIAAAQTGTATQIDCNTLTITHVPIPHDVKIIVRFIAHRTLEGSEYADRVRECAEAERIIGPLHAASLSSVEAIDNTLVRNRAVHVVSENARVRDFARALSGGDYTTAGDLMTSSHRSLATLFNTSNSAMDSAVDELLRTPGVYGARMTGGGFGGCVVALCAPDAHVDGWHVQPVGKAHIQRVDEG